MRLIDAEIKVAITIAYHTYSTGLFSSIAKYNDIKIEATVASEGSGFYLSGFTGYGFKIHENSDGKWALDVDNLNVRGTMSIYELLIQQIIILGLQIVQKKLFKFRNLFTHYSCRFSAVHTIMCL